MVKFLSPSLFCYEGSLLWWRTELQKGFYEQASKDSLCYRVFVKILLTKLVLKRLSPSPLIKPLFILKGWQDEKCVHWKVSVVLQWDCELRILRVEKWGPLNISVSRKTFHHLCDISIYLPSIKWQGCA